MAKKAKAAPEAALTSDVYADLVKELRDRTDHLHSRVNGLTPGNTLTGDDTINLREAMSSVKENVELLYQHMTASYRAPEAGSEQEFDIPGP